MASRIKRRKNLTKAAIAAGCIFAAIALSSGPAQAAFFSVVANITSDGGICSTSESTWISSDQDIRNIPLASGQEILSGGSGHTYLTGPGSAKLSDKRGLDNTDHSDWTAKTYANFSNGAVYSQELAQQSYSSYSSPVLCDAGALGTAMDGGLSSTPYTESVDARSTALSQSGSIQSISSLQQGDTDQPDNLAFDTFGNGSGMIQSYFLAKSQVGWDENSSELNIEAEMHDERFASGNYTFPVGYRWSSFTSSFSTGDEPADEEEPNQTLKQLSQED